MDNTKKNKGKFDWLKRAHEHYNSGRFYDVIFACNQALQIDEAFDRAHLGRALAFYKLHKIEMSLSSVNQTIRCNPQNIKAYILKGDICLEHRKFKDALIAYNQALHIEPSNEDAQRGKKQAESYQSELEKRHSESAQDFSRKIEKIGKTEEQLSPLLEKYIADGDTFYKAKKYQEALDAYVQALQIDPDNRKALKGKARTHVELKQYKEAKETYDILQGPRTIGKLVPYSWGFRERNQHDFFQW